MDITAICIYWIAVCCVIYYNLRIKDRDGLWFLLYMIFSVGGFHYLNSLPR